MKTIKLIGSLAELNYTLLFFLDEKYKAERNLPGDEAGAILTALTNWCEHGILPE